MALAQKPEFVFRRNGRVHLNRQGASIQSTTDSRGVRNSGSDAGYTMFRGSVKSTGYPLHSPVFPSLPVPCVTVCHHTSNILCSFWDKIEGHSPETGHLQDCLSWIYPVTPGICTGTLSLFQKSYHHTSRRCITVS
jgi:hypothetical protein